MDLNIIFQNNENNTLIDEISHSFNNKPKKVYFFIGNIKETGLRLLEEEFADTKAKLFFAIGIDKKNTTRAMLEILLEYTSDVHYYSNNQVNEFNSSTYIFEFDKEAIVYSACCNVSESGLKTDKSVYTKLSIDLTEDSEKKKYKELLKDLLKNVEKDNFEKLTKKDIDRLIEEKEIFSTRQYTHNVQSISELLGKSEAKPTSKEQIDDVYIQDKEIPKVDLSDLDLNMDDFDFSGVEVEPVVETKTVEKPKKNELDIDTSNVKEIDLDKVIENLDNDIETISEEAEEKSLVEDEPEIADGTVDIESILFSKADVKLSIPNKIEEESEEVSEEDSIKVKKVNLNNVTNFIYELPSRTSKGQDTVSLKFPNYIKEVIPNFFMLSDSIKNIERDGVSYKKRNIKLEIVNVKTNEKFTDRNAEMIQRVGQTYFLITSDVIKNVIYEENDIARIIKLADDIYHIEFIAQDLEEYKVWEKLCNKKFKAVSRKYGMM